MQLQFIKEIITKDISVINTQDRIFEGIATAEMVDKQGEITVRDSLLKQFPIWMKRGAPIMDTHTNRHVGKGLNFAPVEVIDPTTKKKYYGIKITAQIFEDNKLDDEVWKFITNGKYKGLSFGGANRSERIPVKQADGSLAFKLDDLELYEMSVCQEPAVPIAVITDFNKLAKSLTASEMDGMTLIKKDNGDIAVKCKESKCYIISGDPEAHLQKSELLENDADITSVNKSVDVEMLNTGNEGNSINNMKTEEKLRKNESEEDEEEKTSKVKEESEEVISEENEEDDKDKAITKLADSIGKYVDHSEKRMTKLEKKIDSLADKISKQLEAPAPARDDAPNSKVKIPNDYVDAEQGSADPADAEGEDDKISVEEKSEEVIAERKTKSDDDWTQSVRGGGQAGEGLKKQSNPVLEMCRKSGAEGLGEIANLINKGHFGKVNNTSFGEGYPEV